MARGLFERLTIGIAVTSPGDDAVGPYEDGAVAEVVARRAGCVPDLVTPAECRVAQGLVGAEVQREALAVLQGVDAVPHPAGHDPPKRVQRPCRAYLDVRAGSGDEVQGDRGSDCLVIERSRIQIMYIPASRNGARQVTLS